MPELPCPICNKGKIAKLYLKTRELITGEEFLILECDFCTVKKTFPVPENLSSYYEKFAEQNMRRQINRVLAVFRNMLLNMEIDRIVKSAHVKEFLDIGCGIGDLANLLHKKGYRIFCADSAIKKPVYIRNTGVPYYSVNYENYEIKNFTGLKNGVAIVRHVLEHIKEPDIFLDKLLSYGAKTFYIVVPNIDSLRAKLLGHYNYYLDPPRHIWHFNKMSLKILFEKHNLKILSSGFDTIPSIVPDLYRFLYLNKLPERICEFFNPKGIISTLSLPLGWLLPGNVIWFLVKWRGHG